MSAPISRAHDRLVSLLAEDPCVRIDEFGGEFYLDSRSSLFRRVIEQGAYEPELTRVCLDLVDLDGDVLDIGANVGFHSVLFGKRLRKGRVLAVEPMPRAIGRLRRNLERNGVESKVALYEGVATSEPGELTIRTIVGREEFSSLGSLTHPSVIGSPVETVAVKASTVDALVASFDLKPKFMKVDVEGCEHLVMRGAGQVLSEFRPIVLAELSDPLLRSNGSSAAEVIRLMQDKGYRVVDPLRPGSPPGLRPFGDILCTPE
ncbi:MAG: FkbM family methyltransferase [Lautropia sp.]